MQCIVKYQFNYTCCIKKGSCNQIDMKKILAPAPKLAVYQKDDGHRLVVATAPFAQGSLLHEFGVREFVPGPTYFSVQIGPDQHIHLAPEFLQYINHGCNPNIYFDVAGRQLVCLKDIAANEEITFFYPSMEWALLLPFECHCGSSDCIGRVQGAAHLDKTALSKHRFAEHILQKLSLPGRNTLGSS